MEIALFLHHVEEHTDGVKKSAYEQEQQGYLVYRPQHGLYREDNCPAHKYITHHRGLAEFFQVDGVQHYADHRRRPYYAEKRPAKSTPQWYQCDGCVSSRNQEKYCVVIHYAEKSLCSVIRDGVVQGGHGVQDYQRSAVYRTADNAPGIGVDHCKYYQYHRSRDGKSPAYTVAHGVEYLFPEGISFLFLFTVSAHITAPFELFSLRYMITPMIAKVNSFLDSCQKIYR